MRKYLPLCLCWALLAVPVQAQKSKEKAKKGSITRADIHFRTAKLDLAKEEIDLLAENPKMAKRINVWMLRGKIYRAILLSEDIQYRRLSEKAGVIAAQSFEKVMQLREDDKSSVDYAEAFNAREELWGHHIQQGIDYYNIKDYKKAHKEFSLTLEIKPEDSVSLSYTAFLSQLNKDYDQALSHYYKLIALERADLDVYKRVVNLERVYTQDSEKTLVAIQKAIQKFPNEIYFKKEELLVLIEQGKESEIRKKIQKVVTESSEDTEVLLYVASFYDGQAEGLLKEKQYEAATPYLDSAALYYAQALKAKPDHLAANFNIALAYINMSRQYYEEAQNMDLNTYEKEGEAVEEKGKAIISKALPYLEKAYALEPKDMDVLVSLRQVLYQMGMKEKVAEYDAYIKALEEKNTEK